MQSITLHIFRNFLTNHNDFQTREHDLLDTTTLTALKDVLPTHDERHALNLYMKKAGNSDEKRAQAFADLSECEKYMYCMLNVSDAAAKFDCLIFRSQFQSRYADLLRSITVLEKACDEVRSSDKLRQIIAMILTLVNQINTGGDGNGAAGFSLDALLKLNEVCEVNLSIMFIIVGFEGLTQRFEPASVSLGESVR